MSRRFIPVLIAAVVAAGLTWADDPPPDPGDGPVRLKKKTRPGSGEPDKADPAKPPRGEDQEKKAREPAKEEDPRGKNEPEEPDQNEKEVLQRVGKNMRSVEERLGNKELNEGTRQLQEDILKDLDSLIRMSQQPQDKNNSSSSADSSSSPEMNSKQGNAQSQRRQQARAKRQNQRNQMARNQPMGGRQGEQPQDQQANNTGNEPGAGGRSNTGGPDRNADLYKDIWGHLPESLRAEMNAYSNPQAFMNKYDELIKKYYTTIAEKGRRKGD